MNVFQKPEIAKEFKDATTNEELYKVAYKHIGLEDQKKYETKGDT